MVLCNLAYLRLFRLATSGPGGSHAAAGSREPNCFRLFKVRAPSPLAIRVQKPLPCRRPQTANTQPITCRLHPSAYAFHHLSQRVMAKLIEPIYNLNPMVIIRRGLPSFFLQVTANLSIIEGQAVMHSTHSSLLYPLKHRTIDDRRVAKRAQCMYQ